MKPFILGATFARGGSKGIPQKNIKMLAGKPLIAYAIADGLKCALLDKYIVSTDDPKIADISKECGAEVPFMRPSELAQDDSPEILAWKHAVSRCEEIYKSINEIDYKLLNNLIEGGHGKINQK